MEKERKLVAEILLKEIKRIGEIKRFGICIECNREEIYNYLNLKETETEDLILIRNLLVERLADRIEELRQVEDEGKKVDYEKVDEEHTMMTIVTGIIDEEYYRR